ncbi:MAG: High-affinity zinc uptake system ATP-binding protein ZnuC [Firmicutes bacterium ADurb.Bin193]|nr:MAG: High-affinity zinc uptake system ATP-binding protein ZnuC [Firmicutes bacterium ADurb.Bin193]
MNSIVNASNLSFDYGSGPIFEGVGFSVGRGDYVSIIGLNGSGKSTLLRLIIGQIAPKSGSIRLFGKSLSDFDRWDKVGYVPQYVSYLSGFPATALEIVEANLFSKIGLMRFPKKEHRNKALRALESVGMGEYAKSLIGSLSGGQCQRVMIARAMVNEPELLILDEPMAGIDLKSSASLCELLQSLNKSKKLTILMVTHDMASAAKYSNRIFCIEEGSLVELGKDQLEHELSHRHKH